MRGLRPEALVYLGRYLYRGVIQEKDILRCENGQVSFRYRDAKSGRTQVRTLSGAVRGCSILWTRQAVFGLKDVLAQKPGREQQSWSFPVSKSIP